MFTLNFKYANTGVAYAVTSEATSASDAKRRAFFGGLGMSALVSPITDRLPPTPAPAARNRPVAGVAVRRRRAPPATDRRQPAKRAAAGRASRSHRWPQPAGN